MIEQPVVQAARAVKMLRTSLRDKRRLLSFLWRQRVVGFDAPASPALDRHAQAYFSKRLASSSGYLEFGSGGSTLAADRLRVPTLSVEIDRYFAAAISAQLSSEPAVIMLVVDLGLTREWSYPVFKRMTARRVKRWKKYVSDPFAELDALGWFPDFVLVDGRFRRACMLETARQAQRRSRPVTILVDDYFDPVREHYAVVEKWLPSPERCGRAAIFEINPNHLKPINEASVSEALADFR